MRSLCSEEQISRFMETLCYVSLLLTKDVIAHRVILFCFNQFSPSHTRVSIFTSLFLKHYFIANRDFHQNSYNQDCEYLNFQHIFGILDGPIRTMNLLFHQIWF